MKKIVSRGIVFVLIAIVAVVAYVFKPHANVKEQSPDLVVEATLLIQEFETNQEVASTKYLNKIVAVSGEVTAVSDELVTVNHKIIAEFESTPTQNEGQITFKGRCLGYDELLEEIRFDQCHDIALE